MNDDLAHYGVKGMRWGVRRESRRAHNTKVKGLKKSRSVEKRAKWGRDLEKMWAHQDAAMAKVNAIEKRQVASIMGSSKGNRAQRMFNLYSARATAQVRRDRIVQQTEDRYLRQRKKLRAETKAKKDKVRADLQKKYDAKAEKAKNLSFFKEIAALNDIDVAHSRELQIALLQIDVDAEKNN